jgi:hypothetical protein
MAFTTADISIRLLMDTTNTLPEIESRMNARAFGVVHNPEQGPEVRRVLEELLQVLTAPAMMGASERPLRLNELPALSLKFLPLLSCLFAGNPLLPLQQRRLPIDRVPEFDEHQRLVSS